jgi:hypothetical protein
MRRILVTGRGGQLATGLETALPAQGFEALLVGQPEFEFDKPETVVAAFQALKPDAVVNCAAWTAVDAAKDDEAGAFRANALGPALLGQLSRDAGIPIIHISTDYVFDGLKGAPYLESDLPNPVDGYGRISFPGNGRRRPPIRAASCCARLGFSRPWAGIFCAPCWRSGNSVPNSAWLRIKIESRFPIRDREARSILRCLKGHNQETPLARQSRLKRSISSRHFQQSGA